MTRGSHCPNCGRPECRWTYGKLCETEANTLVPAGYRVTPWDVVCPEGETWGFVIEERRQTFFGLIVWWEKKFYGYTLDRAVEKLNRQLEVKFWHA